MWCIETIFNFLSPQNQHSLNEINEKYEINFNWKQFQEAWVS